MKKLSAAYALLLIVSLAGCATQSGPAASKSAAASAQPGYSDGVIFGSVKAPDHTPRIDVEIRLLPPNWTAAKLSIGAVLSRPAATKTNADGLFVLPEVKPGSYTLFASRPASQGTIPHFTAPVTVPFKGKDGIQAIF
ncbi:carboxypeptidase regulatory-like domain-containing protein [Rhizobium leguminosarum]|uniref:carboxypeptidase-like regulatory domain-containing protein n=1 Tax=Rhizobium leguminosarum TaxID=384 RepID=UPI001031AE12|nr:carboxypeptidase-like regulatory domain-containing protein [Rhizobium leguminosarum]NKL63119.1 hypothetical protein [Rhizobium leguminosarum bv. viciae]TBC92775.1 carboxypeptidase regulatory-like domain-containing protein [Rhizobium leguminosarum]